MLSPRRILIAPWADRRGSKMHGHDMYDHYRLLTEELVNCAIPSAVWFGESHAIMRQLDLEAGGLVRLSAKLLYNELGDQFEHEAFQTAIEYRRSVLMAAIKLLEFRQPSLNTKPSSEGTWPEGENGR